MSACTCHHGHPITASTIEGGKLKTRKVVQQFPQDKTRTDGNFNKFIRTNALLTSAELADTAFRTNHEASMHPCLKYPLKAATLQVEK